MNRTAGAALALSAVCVVQSGAATADSGDDAEVRDSFDWLWISAGSGWELVNLRTFELGDGVLSAELVATEAHGPVQNLAAGVRLWPLALGIRGSWAALNGQSSNGESDELDMWSLAVEAELRSPVWVLEPFIALGAGYRSVGSLGDAVGGLGRGLDITGSDLRLGAGLEVYPTARLSLGIRAQGALIMLSGNGVAIRELLSPDKVDSLGEVSDRALQADGVSLGTSVSLTGTATLHF